MAMREEGLRRPVLEDALARLTATKPVVWISAPRFSGKRHLVSSWLRTQRREGDSFWITVPSGHAVAEGVLLRLITFIEGTEHEQGVPSWAGRGLDARREKAIEIARARRSPLLVVLDVGDRGMSTDEVADLMAFALDAPRLRLIVVQDALSGGISGAPSMAAHIGERDLRFTERELADLASQIGGPLPQPILRQLVYEHDGNAAMVAATVDELSRVDGQDLSTVVQRAQARVLVDFVQRVSPIRGLELVLLLVLIGPLEEEFVLGASGAPYLQPDELRALSWLGLIEPAALDSAIVYRLPANLVEVVRAFTLPQYLRGRDSLYRVAADYLAERLRVGEAVEQLLRIPDPEGAARLFADSWDAVVASQGVEEARRIVAQLPLSAVLGSVATAAAAWLVTAIPPEAQSTSGLAAVVLGARQAEFGALDLRHRVTVRTAQVLLYLERDGARQAETALSDAFSDLERADAMTRAQLGEVQVELLLAAGRVALQGGDLRRATAMFGEASASADDIQCLPGKYRALVGRAVALALNAEFGLSQQFLDEAAALERHGGLELSRVAQEAMWCQSLLFVYTGERAALDALHADAQARARRDSDWLPLAQLIEARLLLRAGLRMDAVNVLNGLASSVEPWQRHLPLIRQLNTHLLALALVLANRPGSAVGVLQDVVPNHDHVPCAASVQAYALIAQGDPSGAVRVTDDCVRLGHGHANLTLFEVSMARALAFEVLGMSTAAENELIAALTIAARAPIALSLGEMNSGAYFGIAQRVAAREPRLGRLMEEAATRALTAQADGEVDPASRLGAPATAPIATITPGLLVMPPHLTRKEREILRRLGTDATLAEIAEGLFITENTVKTHARHIYRKLGVTTRRAAADIAAGWGWYNSAG